VTVVHAVVAGIALGAAVRDATANSFIGAPLATVLLPAVVAAAIGILRLRTGLPGGRPILLAADATVLLAAANELALRSRLFRAVGEEWLAGLIGLAVLGAALLLLGPRSADPGAPRPALSGRHVDRTRGHAAVGITVLALVAVAYSLPLLEPDQAGRPLPLETWIPALFVPLAFIGIALVPWWWGSPWLLAAAGLGGAVAGTVAVLSATQSIVVTSDVLSGAERGSNASITPSLVLYLVASVLAIAAAVRGPRLAPDPSVAPAGARAGAGVEPAARPWPAVVWLIAAGLLWVPSIGLSLSPPVSDTCRSCDAFFLSQVLDGFDLLSLVAVPIAVIVAVIAMLRRGVADPGPRAARAAAVPILLAAAAILVVQIVGGLLGVPVWSWMTIATPATILLAMGAWATWRRPVRLDGAGWIAAAASTAVVVTWVVVAFAGGPLQERPAILGDLVGAAIVGLGIIAESALAARAGRA
jgi:hypothetical protein